MFTLKNITIQYGLTPILHYDGELRFYNHNLILLTGLSGCGKSSLLHLIAGILGKNDAYYDFYDHDHQLSEKEIQDFRLQKIAYVSQDHPLFENNTVKENFKMYQTFSFNKKPIQDLLQLVFLDQSILNKKVKNLSGGQKQRLAIALALLKDPQILLLDEPTASLDETNIDQINKILNQLVDQGKCVIIATHHPELFNANLIYHLKDQTIHYEIKNLNKEITLPNAPNKKINLSFFLHYGYLHFNAHPIGNGLLLILLALTIGLTSFNIYFNQYNYNFQTKQINTISDTELFIINDHLVINDPSWGVNYQNDEDEYISQEAFNQIKQIDHVQTAFYYKAFSSNGSCYNDEQGNNIYTPEDNHFITVSQNVTEQTIDLQRDYSLTTWDKDDLNNRIITENKNTDNGVYISDILAQKLGIQDLNNTTLTIQIYIPIGQLRGQTYSQYLVETQNKYQIETPLGIYTFETFSFPIKAIIENIGDEDPNYYYDHNTYHLYLPNDELEALHQSVFERCKDRIDKYYDANAKYGHIYSREKYIYSRDILSDAVIVRVDDYQNVEEVKNKIQVLSSDYVINTKQTSIDTINQLTNNNQSIHRIYPILFIGVLVIACSIVFIYHFSKTKKELALLYMNGIQNIYLASLSFIILILTLSFVLSQSVILILIHYYNAKISLGLSYSPFILGMSLLTILCLLTPTLILNKYKVNHLSFTTLLKND